MLISSFSKTGAMSLNRMTLSNGEADENDDEPIPQIVDQDPSNRFVRYAQSLGKGAFKNVYRAFDEEEGVEVAWNQLRVDHLSQKDAMKLRAEVQLLNNLRHPNIIQLIHSWTAANANGHEVVYFVTELMSSGTLKKYLRKITGTIRPKFLRTVCTQILNALVYLHGLDPPVIHRDLKCENIFVNGNTGQVKLGDLGLATVKQLRHVTSVIGTPEFMAPELYDEKYDEKIDIYAFGMCVLEMVTKEYPYSECHNQAQIYKKVTSGIKPEALKHIENSILRHLIESCLDFDPDNRPTATELLQHPFFKSVETPPLGPQLAAARKLSGSEIEKLMSEQNSLAMTRTSSVEPVKLASAQTMMKASFSADSRLPPPPLVPMNFFTPEGYSNPSSASPTTQSESTHYVSSPAHGNVETVYRIDETTISMKMTCRVPGTTRNQIVKFPFDLESDTPEEVVAEMVKEEVLEESDRDLAVKSLQLAIRRALGLEVGSSSTVQQVVRLERSRSNTAFFEEDTGAMQMPIPVDNNTKPFPYIQAKSVPNMMESNRLATEDRPRTSGGNYFTHDRSKSDLGQMQEVISSSHRRSVSQNSIEATVVVESIPARKNSPAWLSDEPDMPFPSKIAVSAMSPTAMGRVRSNTSDSEHILIHRGSFSGSVSRTGSRESVAVDDDTVVLDDALLAVMEDDPDLMQLWKKQREEADAMARFHAEEWNRIFWEKKRRD